MNSIEAQILNSSYPYILNISFVRMKTCFFKILTYAKSSNGQGVPYSRFAAIVKLYVNEYAYLIFKKSINSYDSIIW